ncbi:cytochrome C [Stenotrophomonas sp. S48]|uniref:c-type cytochrome n=1 Tax=unclassified Stenotrophomonas TaxID=196198 RepID=UPI0018FFE4FA|nr:MULTISPECIES: c-type cytochrome [unclassified Stenotrophomonas]MBK0027738.1 cytochrome C [Stenotrophomonas sp. S48]MBK0049396.1 cytochrome C [Stenotrophomonas sp. S49]
MRALVLPVAFAVALAATGCQRPPAAPASPEQARQQAMQRAFELCAGCHTVKAGGIHRFGPNLHGVLGRRAGSLPDYGYSDAMRRADFVWSAQTLDTFLQSPSHMVPGTRMYNAFPSPERRALVIAYLQEHAQ